MPVTLKSICKSKLVKHVAYIHICTCMYLYIIKTGQCKMCVSFLIGIFFLNLLSDPYFNLFRIRFGFESLV